MIKYLGSKRRLVPILGTIASAVEARSALDLFTGTTRVAQEFKRRGIEVTACDLATYSEVLAECFIATDAHQVDHHRLANLIDELNRVSSHRGYVTRAFCEEARYFQPKNGARIDGIRDVLERDHRDDPLFPVLLTSLMLAADRVDSTTGLQMAYLKNWSPRSHRDLELSVPELLPGSGRSFRGDAMTVVDQVGRADLAYLDPPYNQHRYFTNYHVWETLVRWDAPDTYGVANKRTDSREPTTKSVFDSKRTMPRAFADVVHRVNAEVVVVSYNDEAWITAADMLTTLRDAGHPRVEVLDFEFDRYIGARIGIHNRSGQKAGTVSRLRNTEHIFVAGPHDRVEAALHAVRTQKDPVRA